MNASNIKGALLEYIVRRLLLNCGFTNVKADGIYSFEQSGLFFVNGKGAAHDMDIIMNPPVQMPFAYPTQLIFECKANKTCVNLPMVRNAYGLRNDLNEFEIVTKDSLLNRKNNRRASYAIETRLRFLYQVGVASVNGFSKPAIEFATNNKIPLLSLSWFLDEEAIHNFNNITPSLINSFTEETRKSLYKSLKDRNSRLDAYEEYSLPYELLSLDSNIAQIISAANAAMKNTYIGLLETGDLVFLYIQSEYNILDSTENLISLESELHWNRENPIRWNLTIFNSKEEDQSSNFYFYLPQRIVNFWEQFSKSKKAALGIKAELFSKIFIFNKKNNIGVPITIVNLDKKFLEEAVRKIKNDKDE